MPKKRKKGHVTTGDTKKEEKRTCDNRRCQKNRKKGHVTTGEAKKQEKRTYDNS